MEKRIILTNYHHLNFIFFHHRVALWILTCHCWLHCISQVSIGLRLLVHWTCNTSLLTESCLYTWLKPSQVTFLDFFFLYIIGATGRFPHMEMLLLCTSISACTSHPLVFCLLGSALSTLWKPFNQSGARDCQHPPAWLHFARATLILLGYPLQVLQFSFLFYEPQNLVTAKISSSSPPFFI